MVRRAVAYSLIVLALGLAGLGAYSLFQPDPSPPEVEPPTFVPPSGPLPQSDEFAHLARTDPVRMFEACLARYAKETKGFTGILDKQERVFGKLHDREIVRVTVWGEVPESPGQPPQTKVRMIWESGFQKDPIGNDLRGTLFVTGQNKDQVLTYRPEAWVKEWSVDPKKENAREASRYCIRDSGLYRGMLRTYAGWKKRQTAGELQTEYLGRRTVERIGVDAAGKPIECHVIRRTCPTPEVDSFSLDEQASTDPKIIERNGVTDVTMMIDAERWLHVGTILKNAKGDLIGEYYFRDVRLTTEPFPPETFTMDGLKAAIAAKR